MTADFYGRDSYRLSPASDPRGHQVSESRVLRGGSWLPDPTYIRASLRYPAAPGSPDQVTGMRCADDNMP